MTITTVSTPSTLCPICTTSSEIRHRWHKDGHDIVECRSCGLLFRRHLPSEEEIEAIYQEEYFRDDGALGGTGYRDYLADESEHRLTARRRITRLRRHVAPPQQLLDVGCAAGFFLDEARRSGFNVDGIDVAPTMTRHAAEVIGIPVKTGLFQSSTFQEETYDCVTMWDYIEHSLAPIDDIAKAHSLLRPEGTLVIATGDARTLVAKISGRRWHLLTPRHHNFFFSAKSLRIALEKHGFTIVETVYPPAWYSVGYLIHKLQTMLPARAVVRVVIRVLEQFGLSRFSVPVNLFDIVTVVAVKNK